MSASLGFYTLRVRMLLHQRASAIVAPARLPRPTATSSTTQQQKSERSRKRHRLSARERRVSAPRAVSRWLGLGGRPPIRRGVKGEVKGTSAAGNGLSQNQEARELRTRFTSALLARNLRVRSVEGAKDAVPSLLGRHRTLRGVMMRARGPPASPNAQREVREGEKSSRPNVRFTGFCRLVPTGPGHSIRCLL